jgi:hypothetical protein
MKLEGMLFDIPAAFLSEIEEILGEMSIPEWDQVVDERKAHLRRCIDAEGEYVENDKFDFDL